MPLLQRTLNYLSASMLSAFFLYLLILAETTIAHNQVLEGTGRPGPRGPCLSPSLRRYNPTGCGGHRWTGKTQEIPTATRRWESPTLPGWLQARELEM